MELMLDQRYETRYKNIPIFSKKKTNLKSSHPACGNSNFEFVCEHFGPSEFSQRES